MNVASITRRDAELPGWLRDLAVMTLPITVPHSCCSRPRVTPLVSAARPLAPHGHQGRAARDHWAARLGAPFRRTYFWIFPVAVFGSSLTKVTPLGALKCAR